MSILDKIKGSDNLDSTITVKVNSADKEELVQFCADNKISMGKLVREGLEMIIKEIKKEIR